jgi:hypothetical protein
MSRNGEASRVLRPSCPPAVRCSARRREVVGNSDLHQPCLRKSCTKSQLRAELVSCPNMTISGADFCVPSQQMSKDFGLDIRAATHALMASSSLPSHLLASIAVRFVLFEVRNGTTFATTLQPQPLRDTALVCDADPRLRQERQPGLEHLQLFGAPCGLLKRAFSTTVQLMNSPIGLESVRATCIVYFSST